MVKVVCNSAKRSSVLGASALSLRYFWETYINIFIAPEKVQFELTRYNSCLQGLHRSDIITPGTSTVASSFTWFPSVRSLDCSDEALVNAFIMSGLFFPPNTRFVLLCHHVTPSYSARRRLSRFMS